jgi:hypothetical protein
MLKIEGYNLYIRIFEGINHLSGSEGITSIQKLWDVCMPAPALAHMLVAQLQQLSQADFIILLIFA